MRKQKLEQTETVEKRSSARPLGLCWNCPKFLGRWLRPQEFGSAVAGAAAAESEFSTVTFECLLQLFIQVGVASLADDCGCADFAHLQARPLFEFLVMSCSMPLPMSLHQSLHLHLAASVFAPFGQESRIACSRRTRFCSGLSLLTALVKGSPQSAPRASGVSLVFPGTPSVDFVRS